MKPLKDSPYVSNINIKSRQQPLTSLKERRTIGNHSMDSNQL